MGCPIAHFIKSRSVSLTMVAQIQLQQWHLIPHQSPAHLAVPVIQCSFPPAQKWFHSIALHFKCLSHPTCETTAVQQGEKQAWHTNPIRCLLDRQPSRNKLLLLLLGSPSVLFQNCNLTPVCFSFPLKKHTHNKRDCTGEHNFFSSPVISKLLILRELFSL